MRRIGKPLLRAKANPTGVCFADLVHLLEAAGFELGRQKGSHRVYKREGLAELVVIQPRGKDAKPYQVRQVLELIEKYGLSMKER